MSDILLQIKDLSIVYATEDGVVQALTNANLTLRQGETLGLVGETGAGKTTLARGIMRLIIAPTRRERSSPARSFSRKRICCASPSRRCASTAAARSP